MSSASEFIYKPLTFVPGLNLILILAFIVIMPKLCFSKDFGKAATTYKTAEEGFVAMMQRKLQEVDIEQENKKMIKLAKEGVENPKPLSNLKKALKTRTFYFDPTYILLEDIVLPDGQVLHKAGKEVNPLDHMKLNRKMFFIDARDESQIKWLKDNLKKDIEKQNTASSDQDLESTSQVESRIILTGGKIFEIEKDLKKLGLSENVYFDQAGELTSRFGIKAVPAIAGQENKQIKITEFDIEEEKDSTN